MTIIFNVTISKVDCPFYKLVEFDAELPGTSQLIVDVMDKDTIGSDDLIGSTTIDLEDRWFDKRWQELGSVGIMQYFNCILLYFLCLSLSVYVLFMKDNMVTPEADASKARWKTKPLELRGLHIAGTNQPRGSLQMWVDILTTEDAITFPPDDVSLPPTQVCFVDIFRKHVLILVSILYMYICDLPITFS